MMSYITTIFILQIVNMHVFVCYAIYLAFKCSDLNYCEAIGAQYKDLNWLVICSK